MNPSNNPTEHLSLRIPVAVAEAVRQRAREEDRTVSSVIRRALHAHLEDRVGSDVRIGAGEARPFEGASR